MASRRVPGTLALCIVSFSNLLVHRPFVNSGGLAGLEVETTAMSFSDKQQVTVLHDSIVATRRKFIADFDDVDESFVHNTTIDGFLEYIERQRLTHMPHRGSHWDKVLKWAEYFALQISGYVTAVEPFMPDSRIAAQLIWTALRSLLRVSLSSLIWVVLTRPARSRECAGHGNNIWNLLPSGSFDFNALAKQRPSRGRRANSE